MLRLPLCKFSSRKRLVGLKAEALGGRVDADWWQQQEALASQQPAPRRSWYVSYQLTDKTRGSETDDSHDRDRPSATRTRRGV
jgi:hypothetical protein